MIQVALSGKLNGASKSKEEVSDIERSGSSMEHLQSKRNGLNENTG